MRIPRLGFLSQESRDERSRCAVCHYYLHILSFEPSGPPGSVLVVVVTPSTPQLQRYRRTLPEAKGQRRACHVWCTRFRYEKQVKSQTRNGHPVRILYPWYNAMIVTLTTWSSKHLAHATLALVDLERHALDCCKLFGDGSK